MERGRRRPNAVFMAFGTKGDVNPLAVIAVGLAKARPDYLVSFITHASHEGLRRPLASSGIFFFPLSSPAVLAAKKSEKKNITMTEVRWSNPENLELYSVQDGQSVSESSWKISIERQHREECLKAVDSILGSVPYGNIDFIVINFFALEGWHLAELYHVPCVVAAPYVMPYSAPASFVRQFQAIYPMLYKHLQQALPGQLGWDDIMHWMWPLFTNRWTEWRVECLHLSACPLTDPITGLPLHHWPCKPLLLYGFSKEVVECPSYWPSNVHICGFWFCPWECGNTGLTCCTPDRNQSEGKGSCLSSGEQTLCPLELSSFLAESKEENKPIFIGLSSIGSMGFLENPEGMLSILEALLDATDRRILLFTSAYAPLDAAILAASACNGSFAPALDSENIKRDQDMSGFTTPLENGVLLFKRRLLCFSGCVPYLWLFPNCSLVIHHGGSGTTAAALHSGIPQIICPFMLDQFYWAERMAWIGVAAKPLKKHYLVPNKDFSREEVLIPLLHAIEDASNSDIKARAAALGEKIREEDGVANAIETLCQELGI